VLSARLMQLQTVLETKQREAEAAQKVTVSPTPVFTAAAAAVCSCGSFGILVRCQS
jgi:hypothetical protein